MSASDDQSGIVRVRNIGLMSLWAIGLRSNEILSASNKFYPDVQHLFAGRRQMRFAQSNML
jgi:hypothetical protein